jgi:hypothetical protein
VKTHGNNELTTFVELAEPAISLAIVGIGNDTIPVVEMVAALGL